MTNTRIDCGIWTIGNNDCELAESMFGHGGTQRNRRWFYRLLDTNPRSWSIKNDLRLVLYFRNSADAMLFSLKRTG